MLKKLARALTSLGLIITTSAIIWWHAFFRVIAKEFAPEFGEADPTLGPAIHCLYSNGGPCRTIIDAAQTVGTTPYHPALLWVGLGILVFGMVLKLMRGDTSR